MSGFQKAVKRKAKLKLALTGASGSGKTYSALRMATGMSSKVAFIDTENNSASLYSDRFAFDVLDLAPPFTHDKFAQAVQDAVAAGYEVVVIDSASHFWEGVLAYKDALDKRGGNSYTNWNEAGQKFKIVLDAVLQSPIHVICCMRSKMDYVQEKDDRGKTVIRKVGLAPIMRDGISFEFTTVLDIDEAHHAKASKDRTAIFGDHIFQVTEETGKKLLEWLNTGADAPPPVVAATEQRAHKWTPEQVAEYKRLEGQIQDVPWLLKFKEDNKGKPPADIIDALTLKLKG